LQRADYLAGAARPFRRKRRYGVKAEPTIAWPDGRVDAAPGQLGLDQPRRILSLIQSRVSGTTFRPKRRATGFCAAAHYVYTTLANHSKRLADNLANSA
jgi:hypothetical protein